MLTRYGPWIVLAAMLVGGAAVLLGDVDESVSLSAAMEVWGDVIRDVDQLGLSLTRMSDQNEMELGRKLSHEIVAERPSSSPWQPYVAAVGQGLVPHVRRQGIHYEFHVVDASWINAFALPGGQIVISTGMLEFLKSEAELAAILGHEMSHVDQRHCIEQFQTQIALERIGMDDAGHLATLTRRLLAAGYRKHQELEADAAGLRLAVAAGYDPQATVSPFERLEKEFREPVLPPAREPISEVTGSLAEALGSYFESHPPTADRISRLHQLIAQQHLWIKNKSFYVGVENYKLRIPKSKQQFAGETAEAL